MNTKTKIANMALSLLRINAPIIDIDQATVPSAVICKTHIDTVIQELLEEHQWFFANEIAQLPALDEESKHENYTCVFKLPSDCLVCRSAQDRVKYQVIGKKVYADSETITIEYTKDIDMSFAPGYFINSCAYYLAFKIAAPLGNSTSKVTAIFQVFEHSKESAKQTDAFFSGNDFQDIYTDPNAGHSWLTNR